MNDNNLYKIGAISRLTGIPTVTIRMWERRYGLVTPQRTEAGGRLYTQEDLQRLGLVKRAVDAGHAISTVANLPNEEILARFKLDEGSTDANLNEPIQLAIVGEYLGRRISQQGDHDLFITASSFNSIEAAKQSPSAATKIDVVVVEKDFIDITSGKEIAELRQHLNAKVALVVYGFGDSQATQALESSLIRSIKGPVNINQLARASVAALGLPNFAEVDAPEELQQLLYQPIPARRFGPARLAELTERSDVVKCECPNHLAELITSLNAFEQYSEHCENRNKEDAAMHMLLHVTTAKARRMLEDALNHLVEFEGTTEAG